MRRKVIVFGSNGMLGKAFASLFSQSQEFILYTAARKNADFCFDFCDDEKLRSLFCKIKPDIVINCAAVVNLSLCEQDKLSAYLVNARFVSVLAAECEKYSCSLVHISTDHYYSGDSYKKHTETESVRFFNEYARTKFSGEQFALQYKRSLVVRTNIVGFRGSPDRQTFLEWAVSTVEANEPINLFFDFYTSSIHTVQLAKITSDLICLNAFGLFNVASSDVFSKKEFILKLSEILFSRSPPYSDSSVKSLECARADSLGLDCTKAEKLLGYSMPNMESVIRSIAKEYGEIK